MTPREGSEPSGWEIMAAMSLEQFLENYRATIDRLYSTSNVAVWCVSRSSFAGALWRSFGRRFGPDTGSVNQAEGTRFLDSLHVADLALAIGCHDGDAEAWRHLVSTYRAPVDAFARAVLGNSSRANWRDRSRRNRRLHRDHGPRRTEGHARAGGTSRAVAQHPALFQRMANRRY